MYLLIASAYFVFKQCHDFLNPDFWKLWAYYFCVSGGRVPLDFAPHVKQIIFTIRYGMYCMSACCYRKCGSTELILDASDRLLPWTKYFYYRT